jgi:hypothetical protein
MPPIGFEPIISAGVQPQTYALDRESDIGLQIRIAAMFVITYVRTNERAYGSSQRLWSTMI